MKNENLSKLIRSLERAGWRFVSMNKHYKYRAPNGKTLIFSGSPRSPHSRKATIKDANRLFPEGQIEL